MGLVCGLTHGTQWKMGLRDCPLLGPSGSHATGRGTKPPELWDS